MPSELDKMVMAERFEPIKSPAPAGLAKLGQAWIDGSVRCYKCVHFTSNRPHTGTCNIGVRSGLLTTHDMMPGDGCKTSFEPKWLAEGQSNAL